ncbi:amino acid permease [Rhodococcus qingshengii]|uniref:amino acid permease n=1 Tax=Rhodococcus qingshengii TaxID=334542 RepID=UPI0037CA652E
MTDDNLSFAEKLSSNRMFVLLIVLAVYWLATFIAFRGANAFARVAKWGGIVDTIIPAAILIVLGFSYIIAGNTSPGAARIGNLSQGADADPEMFPPTTISGQERLQAVGMLVQDRQMAFDQRMVIGMS